MVTIYPLDYAMSLQKIYPKKRENSSLMVVDLDQAAFYGGKITAGPL
jgi:hypothetical protein